MEFKFPRYEKVGMSEYVRMSRFLVVPESALDEFHEEVEKAFYSALEWYKENEPQTITDGGDDFIQDIYRDVLQDVMPEYLELDDEEVDDYLDEEMELGIAEGSSYDVIVTL